jgi:hypothetical protein
MWPPAGFVSLCDHAMDRHSLLPLTLSAMLATTLHVGVLSLPRPAEADTTRQISPLQLPLPDRPEDKPLDPEPEKPEPPTPEEPKPEPPKPDEPKPEPEAAVPPKLSDEVLPEPEPAKMEIGKEDAPRIATIAWISHDDFQELMAMQSRTIQPGLQREAVAQADAPLNFEPAQPRDQFGMPELATGVDTQDPGQGRDAAPDRNADSPPAEPQPAAEAPANPVERTSPDIRLEQANDDQQLAMDPPAENTQPESKDTASRPEAPSEDAGRSVSTDPGPSPDALTLEDNRPEPSQEQLALGPITEPRPPVPDVTAAPATQPGVTPDAPSAASAPSTQPAGEKPRQGDGGQMDQTRNMATQESPTSVTQSDRESVPTQLTPSADRVRLGNVVASRGIEIKTVRPRISIATRYTATPRNPHVRVVFDRQGQVLLAEITRSSGYADIDGPILNALYAWRASGKMLQEMKSSTFEWRGIILMGDEPDTP